jgi:hypothetical protein
MRILIALLLLGALNSSSYAWGPEQDKSCIESCQKNPSVPYARKDKCPSYCACISGEVNKHFKPDEQVQLVKDMSSKTDSLNAKRFKSIVPMCARRTFQ